MTTRDKKRPLELSRGLKSQLQRQAKRRSTSEMYAQLVHRVQEKIQGGPEKVFNAAVRAGEAKGLSLSTLKRKCANPERIGSEWQEENLLCPPASSNKPPLELGKVA